MLAQILFILGVIYLPPKVPYRWDIKFMIAQVSRILIDEGPMYIIDSVGPIVRYRCRKSQAMQKHRYV